MNSNYYDNKNLVYISIYVPYHNKAEPYYDYSEFDSVESNCDRIKWVITYRKHYTLPCQKLNLSVANFHRFSGTVLTFSNKSESAILVRFNSTKYAASSLGLWCRFELWSNARYSKTFKYCSLRADSYIYPRNIICMCCAVALRWLEKYMK